MDNLELLLKEIQNMCSIHDIKFKWTHDVHIGCYVFEFRKGEKGYRKTINEMHLYTKPFAVIKADVESTLFTIIRLM